LEILGKKIVTPKQGDIVIGGLVPPSLRSHLWLMQSTLTLGNTSFPSISFSKEWIATPP
jgi:hypothetical protein